MALTCMIEQRKHTDSLSYVRQIDDPSLNLMSCGFKEPLLPRVLYRHAAISDGLKIKFGLTEN